MNTEDRLPDIYTRFVVHVRREAQSLWEEKRSELQAACHNLEIQLANSKIPPPSDGQLLKVERDIQQLEKELAELKVTVRRESADLLAECERQLGYNHVVSVRNIPIAAESILPRSELIKRSPKDLERYFADHAAEIDEYRRKMKLLLIQADQIIGSQPHSESQVVDFEQQIRTCDAEIDRIRDAIIRSHEVHPSVMASQAELNAADIAKLRTWMQEQRADAEIERSWRVPESVFSGTDDKQQR